jgi:UDP-N-acetylmuramate--alanine ligase
MKNIHFLGINGSGIVGVACLTKLNGFTVSGCDMIAASNYSHQLEELDIKVEIGHSPDHLKGIDVLVISAAVLFNDKYKEISEIMEAKKRGIPVLKWQEFLDKYLIKKEQDLIAICGTHGKTSTTTIMSNLLEYLNCKPSAIIGGINPKWSTNFKYDSGKYFVCEADEYSGNFHAYHPKYIIFNNIEMEHPEYFMNYNIYEQNFIDFFKNIKKDGAIIFNHDDRNSLNTILNSKNIFVEKNTKIIGFSTNKIKSDYDFIQLNHYELSHKNNSFTFNNVEYDMKYMMGLHNIYNNMSILSLIEELKIKGDVKGGIENAVLPKRRMEVILDNNRIRLYDDYAHHHTQIFYNMSAVKSSKNIDEKIIVVLEPHLISRFSQNSREYLNYLGMADYSIITKFYKSRESFLPDLDMDKYLTDNTKTLYIEEFVDVVEKIDEIMNLSENKDIKFNIVVMGAGNSYKLSKLLENRYVEG